jgi:hypothetical protein
MASDRVTTNKGINIPGGRFEARNVAVGDRARITVGVEAGDDRDREELLDQIANLRAQVAALTEAPGGERQDAGDELRKAQEAAAAGDHDRMLKKLDAAQKIVGALGTALPAAAKLAETIGGLVQRVLPT